VNRARAKSAVLILGAFGTFGRRITNALSQTTTLPLIAAGRRVPASFAGQRQGVSALAIDAHDLNGALLQDLDAAVLIDTVGPFQGRDRKLAETCIAQGIHYIDLADGREFVQGVGLLNAAALRRDVLVVSGASTLPALSSAVIKHLEGAFSAIEGIEIGVAPGYLGPRGIATIRAVLGYVGRPIPIWRACAMAQAHGWSETTRHRYPPPVGVRLLSLIDVPDTSLLPAAYPTLKGLGVRAGYEVAVVHRTLCFLGQLVRLGLIRDLPHHALRLQRLAAWFDRFGSDNGAMHVQVRGRDAHGRPQSRTWTLVAERGDGPQIPATAAVLLAKKLLQVAGYAPIAARGAVPAVNLVSLTEFEREWRALAIHTSLTTDCSPAVAGSLKGLARRAP
jgi:hypothetical protein